MRTETKGTLVACFFALATMVIFSWMMVAIFSNNHYPAKKSSEVNFSVPDTIKLVDKTVNICPENNSINYNSLEWSCSGDQIYATSAETNPVFSVNTPGTYVLQLVTDFNGKKSSKYKFITVIDARMEIIVNADINASDYFEIGLATKDDMICTKINSSGISNLHVPQFWHGQEADIMVTFHGAGPEKFYCATIASIKDSLAINISAKTIKVKNF